MGAISYQGKVDFEPHLKVIVTMMTEEREELKSELNNDDRKVINHPGILDALMKPEGEKDFSAILMMLAKDNEKVTKAIA